MIRDTDIIPTLEDLLEFLDAFFEAIVVAFDSNVLVHDITEFMVELMRIFRTVHVADLVELCYALLTSCFEFFVRESGTKLAAACETQGFRTGNRAGISSRQQGVCTKRLAPWYW